MSCRLFLKRAATSDLDEAVAWYEAQKPGLGLRLLGEATDLLERIQRAPLEFPIVHKAIRRGLLNRFPYGVFFLLNDESISVLAITHLRRDPRVWRSRK